MFGLSWGEITIIVLVGVFLLGPERIPTAVQWTLGSLRKVRTMAAGAQAQLRTEIGPELDELRRQIAELQSLKEVQELKSLRDLHPKNIIGRNVLGEEFSGGITGLLGLTKDPLGPPEPRESPAVARSEPARVDFTKAGSEGGSADGCQPVLTPITAPEEEPAARQADTVPRFDRDAT